jgi:hypothetical protein
MLELLAREFKRKLKGTVRRQTDRFLPTKETREYRRWIAARLSLRQRCYREPLEPGLLSILTAVWDGSPVPYLKQLAESLEAQNGQGAYEWIILDNGCSKAPLTAYLAELASRPWVKIRRSAENIGIVRGLRMSLESAHGRYICPIDADDWIYPDALRALTWALRASNFPPLLFTDEDKIIGSRHYQPYLKPGWDPVLLLNSAYIAHLGGADREKALDLGAYSDPTAEASPDWDLFVRFLISGHSAAHLPEVVYSWRVHAESTADDAASKSSVGRSQQAVLQRFLDAAPAGRNLHIRNSPLLPAAPHWHFERSRPKDILFQTILLSQQGAMSARGKVDSVLDMIRPAAERDELVALIGEDVEIENADWAAEALTITELHSEVVMVGGRIRNRKGFITGAGQYFGICGVCGCPHRGRAADDPGYFAQIWKQRSVSAVTTQFAVVKARFLLEIADQIRAKASLSYLGAWVGAHALRRNRRIVYSPFLSGVSDVDWEEIVLPGEQELFGRENSDLIPDHRFYSPALSTSEGFALGAPGYEPQIQLGRPLH